MLRERGFSLMELMIVIVIVLSISAAIFQTINMTTQRSSTEQTKLDMFQEAREFMDQMSRDLRQAGYPNPTDFDPSVLTISPTINDHHAAVGLVKIADGDLWIEGDVDSSGIVSVVRYHYDTMGTNCPCLKRSQLPKIDADPVNSQTTEVYQVEVQGVQNTAIFSAFSNGTAIGLPVDVSSGSGLSISSVDTVRAELSLQASIIDPETRQYPVTTLVTTVRVNNCSSAASGQKLSCN